ncbi:MAG: zinc-binding dehydrogenase [Dehalococcoidia bacterium]|nr:zinc-binding dehydrogenase [Dehalococcoidia bacterium]
MKAAQLVGPKRFEIMDAEMPVIKDGECLIKLERLSICGSDIRHGYGPVYPEEEYPLDMGKPCHECAGVVVESRTDEFREGQRVIVLPNASAGLVEYVTSYPGRMIALPDHGDLTDWVMCQPSGTVLYSCQQMGSVLGKSVMIVGQGAIGLSFTMLTSRQGARQVIALDRLDYRLEYAKEFGATHTINPDKEDVIEAVREITHGEEPDVTVDAAGYPDTLDMALRMVRPLGRVVIFGIQSDYVIPVDTRLWMDKQAVIIPTSSARIDPINCIKEIVALRDRGWVDPARMVTHRLAFNSNDVNKAYEMYDQRLDNVVKVVMSM